MTWRSDAACAGMDPDLFHPHGNNERAKARAVAVCAGCPARPDCLTHAIDNGEQDGIWGGCDPDERRKEARRRGQRTRATARVRIVVCDWCGDPFTTTHHRARYCGAECVRAVDAWRQRRAKADARRTA